jgi:hypothetical protein
MDNNSIRSIEQLHNGMKNLIRLFKEARKYKDLEIRSHSDSFPLPLPPLPMFMKWIFSHKTWMMSSLHILGKNADSTKTIRADFLVSELPFKHKDVGVGPMRDVLDRIHACHMKDRIGIATSYGNESNMVYLPREMEVTLIYQTSLTSNAAKYLTEFKEKHRRMTVVELSLNNHLRDYLLDHPMMPRSLRRLNKQETKAHTPKEPLKLNELIEDSVEVQLIGGVPGDVIESITAMKSGVNMPPQYWKIIPKPKKPTK